jgi:hypothetical protein
VQNLGQSAWILVLCQVSYSVAGDYVSAAFFLGSISADVAVASCLPDFREIALWFHALPGDSTAIAGAKVCPLTTTSPPLRSMYH